MLFTPTLAWYNYPMDSISFECEVRQVKTLADGSAKLVLNLPEYELDKAAIMMRMIKDLVLVQIMLVAKAEE